MIAALGPVIGFGFWAIAIASAAGAAAVQRHRDAGRSPSPLKGEQKNG